MTNIDLKLVGELAKAIGPTDELKGRFYQTYFGSLLGQTILLVGTLAIYVTTGVLCLTYLKPPLLAAYDGLGSFLFWAFALIPFACIVLFQMVPTSWRALRERRLKAAIISGDPQFKAGYFRLYPYGQADREAFKRLDGADVKILNWVRSTKASLLYLSGASGVGKSSLLAAEVLPKLRDGGWAVIETRLFGAPVECLRTAILDAGGLFAKKPAAELSLRALLVKAAEARMRKGGAPLLLVVDQFEEFLILHREEERATFADFLSDLVNNPIDGLRLVLVFRSDYRPLVFKLDLPPLVAGENWQELAPYDRGEATSFLQGGGRVLSPETLDALFRGLDRIEETRGIYRPITLNMIGLVLERMGRTLEGDPAQLIQRYLTECLTTNRSRDFAKPLLATMITDAGTKEPRSEADLAILTRFEPWQVRATLADLSEPGLVRRLEGAVPNWEIAHDFLARTIGQLIGRLKPTIMERARPLIAPVVLFGWVGAGFFFLALPYWSVYQQQTVKDRLQRLGATFYAMKPEELSVRLPSDMDDHQLLAAVSLLRQLSELRQLNISNTQITSLEPLKGLTRLTSLYLAGNTGIASLEPLKEMTNLTALNLGRHPGITSLEPLKGLTNLNSLNLGPNAGITSLEPLKGLTNLSELEVSNTSITSLEPLKGLTNLHKLGLAADTRITSLEPLRGLTKLTALNLGRHRGITSLEMLKELTNLNWLNLSYDTGITSLEPLKGLTNLSDLYVDYTSITSLEPLKGLTNLHKLSLTSDTGITSLEPLRGLTNLDSLYLDGDTGITSLEPLIGLMNLSTLYISFDTGITSLEPLKGLTKLNVVKLDGPTGITSLEPLKGKTINFPGASSELIATHSE
jgi:Leucine-rich repeat (LRR) protein